MRSIFSFTLVALAALLLFGCVTNPAKDIANQGVAGQRFEATSLGATIGNASPITMTASTPVGTGLDAADAKETTTSTGTGPAGYALATDKEARWWSQNQVQRNIYFRRLPDGTIAFNSNTGTDVAIGADEFSIDPKTGVMTGKGLKLTTSASEPFKASNLSLEVWRQVAIKMSDDQRAVVIKQLEEDRAKAEALYGAASNAVKEITGLIGVFANPASAIVP